MNRNINTEVPGTFLCHQALLSSPPVHESDLGSSRLERGVPVAAAEGSGAGVPASLCSDEAHQLAAPDDSRGRVRARTETRNGARTS